MSLGYMAAIATTVTEELIFKVCDAEMDSLIDYMETYGIDRHNLWECVELQDNEGDLDPKIYDKLEQLYHDLQNEFNACTGLFLWIEYHDADNNGSCYDDVNGAFWCVGNVFTKTKHAKKFEREYGKLQQISFTRLG